MTGARRNEEGFAALWFLGLLLGLLLLSGVCIDLWRVFSERAGMAAAVDAAADAGAAQIDEDAFRSGRVVLDPGRAEAAALDNLATQGDADRLSLADVVVEAERITVRGEGVVQLSLLRVVVAEPIRVEVTAVAEPRVSR